VCGCSAELGMDWRGAGATVAGWDGCRPYPGGAGGQMPAMNGVVQRRQMSYNAAAAGATSYKPEYARAMPPKYVTFSVTTLKRFI